MCYLAWGSEVETYITESLPSDSITVILIKFAYSLNLICSYPIIIYPANLAIENWLCSCFSQNKTKLYWAQNFSRFCITTLAVISAIALSKKIDKFSGLLGSFLCAPLALTFPSILSLKHLSKTRA